MSEFVFISYARKDGKEFAQRLYDDLQKNGIDVWLDTQNIHGGKKWYSELENAIEHASQFIVILTPGAVDSTYVQNEIIAALDRGVEVIPLLAVECKVPLPLKRLQYVDFRTDYAAGFTELYTVLRPRPEDIKEIKITEPETKPDQRIRIMIVDDHDIVVRGLMSLIEAYDDLEVIGTASNGVNAIKAARELEPDVILMDLVMPEMDGADATRAICEILPDVKIIITTSYIDEDTILVTRQAGAIGFLIKNTTGDELYFAIRRAYVNQTTLAPEVAQTLIDALEKTKTQPAALGDDLTEREREVLAQMIEGLTNREIGQRLGISAAVVKNHVSSILSKLGTKSRTRAVVLAVENKII